jgi:hypothetical protein
MSLLFINEVEEGVTGVVVVLVVEDTADVESIECGADV